MDSVLIVSSDKNASEVFVKLLRNEHYSHFSETVSATLAKGLCAEREFGLIIINTPLTDEFGCSFALHLLQNTGAGVVLVVDPDREEMACAETAEQGAMVFARPVDSAVFSKIVRFIAATQNRMNGVRRENMMLHKKLEDIRIINRAKVILMKYLSMTEQQAHRYLEKQAMDLRITRVEVAKNLLSTYDG